MINIIGTICFVFGLLSLLMALKQANSDRDRADRNEYVFIAYFAIAAYCFK